MERGVEAGVQGRACARRVSVDNGLEGQAASESSGAKSELELGWTCVMLRYILKGLSYPESVRSSSYRCSVVIHHCL